MSEKKDNIQSEKQHEDKTTDLQPDEETLHSSDPQDNMKGIVSSLMHETGETFDTNKSPKDAEKEKDEKM